MNETGRKSRKAEPQATPFAHQIQGRRATISVRGKAHVQIDIDGGEVDQLIALLTKIKGERANHIQTEINQRQAVVEQLRAA